MEYATFKSQIQLPKLQYLMKGPFKTEREGEHITDTGIYSIVKPNVVKKIKNMSSCRQKVG